MVVSVSVVVLSPEESACMNAFLFSVVALFRSIDDEEAFEQQSCFDFDEQI